jgi:hypothetical protein
MGPPPIPYCACGAQQPVRTKAMKVIVIAHRNQDASPEELAPLMDAEANHALSNYRDGIVREIYSRGDGNGAVVVLECDGEADAARIMGELPLAKAGLLAFDIYETLPYRGIVQHVK